MTFSGFNITQLARHEENCNLVHTEKRWYSSLMDANLLRAEICDESPESGVDYQTQPSAQLDFSPPPQLHYDQELVVATCRVCQAPVSMPVAMCFMNLDSYQTVLAGQLVCRPLSQDVNAVGNGEAEGTSGCRYQKESIELNYSQHNDQMLVCFAIAEHISNQRFKVS
ncbi:unnamed protein product [Protopolystoma xenopodis]|uniref:Uncharacterized protein n=1 Tax=Protopolystoma xenopodis TaxID=117903 RepID=A0A3S5CRI0_9PLAT|nr:unnamed protein product [Protopolystoma xenopodis]